ncbi:putative mitochondrial hypothetical protein [Leptomonas pyrrhocoris]|uniref:Uncharacterized protein n=1 Tax=Leptomonas pyrrhocoris TaxID=157538 RepID=A0A0M9FUL4_LEPPY|nr:putative mitochondrial hypothetical protein [Leptomonas pyrrhocoris]KPA76277.1 putative mitochondrial hypothetical protein [Leptomonas pyrrhocoris]|eukprot:XP_015654716.1 putative mitochondrial hypothetical protein [Leptomonas pyrrhocoris]
MHALPLRAVGASTIGRRQLVGAASGMRTSSISVLCSGSLLARFHSTTGGKEQAGMPNVPAPSSTAAAAPVQGASAATSKEKEAASAVPPSSAPQTSATSGEATQSSTSSVSPTSTSGSDDSSSGEVTAAEPEPVRWVQPTYEDPDTLPIVDDRGEYIVSRVQWPTGEIAYRTPAPVDDKLAPRFGYNIVQVRKHVSWWKYNQKYPRLSLAYINIQVLFLLGLAWLVAFLTTEYRSATEAMRTPGAMVGEHRGKGPATNQTQKVTFEKGEMSALLDKAQNNWYDATAEASYVGSKEYKMKKIPRPKEFSAEDFRKR